MGYFTLPFFVYICAWDVRPRDLPCMCVPAVDATKESVLRIGDLNEKKFPCKTQAIEAPNGEI